MSALEVASASPSPDEVLSHVVEARFRALHGEPWDSSQDLQAAKRELTELRQVIDRLLDASADPLAPGAGELLANACKLLAWEPVHDWTLKCFGEAVLFGADECELRRLRAKRALLGGNSDLFADE